MLVLAIDTASHLCSAAVYDAGRGAVVGLCVEDIGRGHAERLIAVIDAALERAGSDYGRIDRLAVTVGPGSFTGIRVGIATARGLAVALKRPAVPVTSLEGIARGVVRQRSPGQPFLVVLDARRDEVYAQPFDAAGAQSDEACILSLEAARALAERSGAALAGSGAALIAPQSTSAVLGHQAAPDIADVAAIGSEREPGDAPVPLYLRGPDAKPQTGFALPRRS